MQSGVGSGEFLTPHDTSIRHPIGGRNRTLPQVPPGWDPEPRVTRSRRHNGWCKASSHGTLPSERSRGLGPGPLTCPDAIRPYEGSGAPQAQRSVLQIPRRHGSGCLAVLNVLGSHRPPRCFRTPSWIYRKSRLCQTGAVTPLPLITMVRQSTCRPAEHSLLGNVVFSCIRPSEVCSAPSRS